MLQLLPMQIRMLSTSHGSFIFELCMRACAGASARAQLASWRKSQLENHDQLLNINLRRFSVQCLKNSKYRRCCSCCPRRSISMWSSYSRW
jgi:hypothetical protein